jgi:hypothetical protein
MQYGNGIRKGPDILSAVLKCSHLQEFKYKENISIDYSQWELCAVLHPVHIYPGPRLIFRRKGPVCFLFQEESM